MKKAMTSVICSLVGLSAVMAAELKVSLFPFAYENIAKENGITFKEAVKLCRDIGVDGFDASFTDKRLEEYLEAGLRPCEIYGNMKFLGSDNGRELSRQFVEVAAKVGSKHVMLLPDCFTDGKPTDAEFAKILSGISILIDLAEAKGITVMTEPFGNVQTPSSYLKYLKLMLDHDKRLMLSMDTGNLHCVGRGDDVCDLAAYAADRIRLMHLKDWKKGMPARVGKIRNRETLGLGAVPNEAIVRFMKKRGYDGWYTLENPLEGDTLGDVKRQLAVLRHWLEPAPTPSVEAVHTPSGEEFQPRRVAAIDCKRPDKRPIYVEGWSSAEDVAAADYCLFLDLYHPDGSNTWAIRGDFTQGTHGWERVAFVHFPQKPVSRIVLNALCRKGSGKARFRNVAIDRRSGTGEEVGQTTRTLAPFSREDRTDVAIYLGNKLYPVTRFTPADAPAHRSSLAAGESVVWIADSMRKITPLTFPTAAERARRTITLELAKAETESAQILVSTADDVCWQKGTLELGALKSADGTPFAGQVKWERQGYVPRRKHVNLHPFGVNGLETWLPDPLLPAAPFKVRKGSTQGLWLTFAAHRTCPAGVYCGQVKVLRDGAAVQTVDVRLEVRDFALPETFGLKTAFTLMDGFMRARYPENWKTRFREAADIMLDHRLNPDDITRTRPPEIEDLKHYRSRGMNSFGILNIVPAPKPGSKAKWTLIAKPEEIFTEDFYQEFTGRIRPYYEELKKAGLAELAYVYGFDERQQEYYPGIEKFWKRFKVDFPDLPIMTTAKQYSDMQQGKTNLPSLVSCDAYCPCTYRWTESLNRELRAKGMKLWWYTCCGPRYPHANFADYEYPFVEGRILLGAMTYHFNADGFLFWHVNNWKEDAMPTMALDDTYFPNWDPSGSSATRCPGDGVFLYPAADRVLPSIRLANIRDGVEDYEVLKLAEAKAGRERVDAVVRPLCPALTDFTRDAERIRTMRLAVDKLAE